MRCKGKGQAKARGKISRKQAASQKPHRDLRSIARNGADRRIAFKRGEECLNLQYILNEAFFGPVHVTAKGGCGTLIGTRCATNAQINPPGMQRIKGSELFGNHQRRMVGQHHATRTDTDGFGARRHMGHHDRCRGTGNAGHVVMFGQPIAMIAKLFGMLGKIKCIAKRIRGMFARIHRAKIKKGIS